MRSLMMGSLVSVVFSGCGGVSADHGESTDTGTGGTNTEEPDPTDPGDCLVGSDGCACTVGGGCDPGLSCDLDVCVQPQPSGTGGDSGTGGAESSTGGLGGNGGGASEDDIPWELTGILVNATNPGAQPGDKRLLVWSESTYGCEDPTGSPSCTPERDHARLSIPISASQLMVGSFTMANNAGISETGPNSGADDCWFGGGSLSGNVEIKSIDSIRLVVRLSGLDVLDYDMRQFFMSEDIEVVICE
jgi:hypothetical protein